MTISLETRTEIARKKTEQMATVAASLREAVDDLFAVLPDLGEADTIVAVVPASLLRELDFHRRQAKSLGL